MFPLLRVARAKVSVIGNGVVNLRVYLDGRQG